ncbi:unnamed protein product [marine sediment metagenome]|uniref:DUF6884 domain-containing protein n=1 Tax=marine sediment metagenome TaxID=412755 RepID=X1BLP7_9ZZZZ
MTKKIVLISCASKKLAYKSKAKDLYISTLFRLSFAYAKKLKPDKIFILSAKYGLLNLNDEIATYNETLNNKPVSDIEIWAEKVVTDLGKMVNLKSDMFVFFAGKKYREYILPYIRYYKIPLKGLRIGEQLKFLKNKLEQTD